jgi:signal transduction histidine kinase
MQPLEDPVTQEMELLSKSFSKMAHSLHKRSEYIREFATYVSHEFKTPLTAIQGAGELLLEHYEDMSPEKRRKFIENMLQDSDRLKLLVARLLDLAKAENPTPSKETANLAELLNKIKGKFSSQGLAVEVKSQADYELRIAPELLETVLSNLATNSLQNEATRVDVDVRQQDDEVILEIRDNGRGISPGNRDKIFIPFFTTNREKGGTGLGLRIVQSMIEAHSGKIILGETQEGTLFTLHFPLT